MSVHTLTRRDLLRTTVGAGSALALASAIAPFSLSDPPGKAKGNTIKVGILHSLTGFLAISESALKDAELLAIGEINKAGGVLGKPIEAVIEDPESKFTVVFPEKARKLLLKDRVACVFGCWTSVSRKNVLPLFEENNGLLFYPVSYEGIECSKNVIYTGEVPNQQIIPAIDYLWKVMGKRKFYLLGSDYIFPRVANLIITAHLKQTYQVKPVKEEYTPLGHRDYRQIVADIRATKPDVIVSCINGDSNVGFFNELAAAKLTAADLPVCSVLIDEDDLRGLDPKRVAGHLAALSYFQSIDTPANRAFVKHFKDKYGKDRVTNDAMEAAYFQVYLWKKAVEKARSFEVDRVREALRDLELETPGGKVKVDGKNYHTWKRFRMGKVRKDGQFEIIHESKELIRPVPYPTVAFPGWDCDWTKGGTIRGPQRKIGRP